MLTIGLGGNSIQKVERNQFAQCKDLITVGLCLLVSNYILVQSILIKSYDIDLKHK